MDRNNLDQNRSNKARERQVKKYDPPGWMSTSDLEDELFNAIREKLSTAGADRDEDDFAEVDDYFAGDDNENETEQRRSILWLLGKFRPQLTELLGGPPAIEER